MMIAIVILGLGLVMTATMFPVAWTRARSLTEYTTQQAISQSAAATLGESLHAAGVSYTAYPATAPEDAKFFLSSGSLAGDLFYDPVLHNDPLLRLTCNGPNDCLTHLAVLIPSDTRVHALHMENLNQADVANADPQKVFPPERPFLLEWMPPLCDVTKNFSECNQSYPDGNFPAKCANTAVSPPTGEVHGAKFCARSFYSPRVSVAARMYPPLENPPPADQPGFPIWLDRFNNRRYAWAALHRLRGYVGPDAIESNQVATSTPADKAAYVDKAAAAFGTTRVWDFYVVTLKRPQPTSRFAVQDPAVSLLPNPLDRSIIVKPGALQESGSTAVRALPMPWRVQVEFPALTSGTTPTGVPTEVLVPPSAAGTSQPENFVLAGMFPIGARFVDEVTGQIYRVASRRTTSTDAAILTLDREILPSDLDDSDIDQLPGASGAIDPHEIVRTVWVYPPPLMPDSTDKIVFDDSSPVIGIDVKTISISPPG